MKKILTSFILVIVLTQVMGYYLVFRIRQLELKSEVRMFLKTHTEDEHLTSFEFTIDNGKVLDERFVWEEEDEFSLEGSMYDVIDQKIAGNKITIRCVKDEQENELLKTFEHFQKRQSRDGRGRTATLLHFLGNLYVATEFTTFQAFYDPALTSYCEYKSPLSNRSSEILTPPPKNC